jgi:methyl-accepting chemotaxis protein
VVASEVRSLAGRSAEAAREIAQLITDSVTRVERGTALVNTAGHTMSEVVESIGRVTAIVSGIREASATQDSGVERVAAAVEEMERSTQRNAVLVEQAAGAADGLRGQATALVDSVAVFRV